MPPEVRSKSLANDLKHVLLSVLQTFENIGKLNHGLQEMCSQMEIDINSFPTHKAIDKSFHIAYLHPYFN